MNRGEIVIVSAPGDYGKPRPGVVVQSDAYNSTHDSIAICLISSSPGTPTSFRIPVHPTAKTRLRKESQIMIDKIMTFKRSRIGGPIGSLDTETMAALDRGIAIWLGLAD